VATLVALLAAGALSATAAPGTRTAAPGTRTAAPVSARLPDLDQEAPTQLQITRVGPPGRRIYRLGFRSAVSNVGRGPLIIKGHRPDAGTPEMTADQLIERRGAPPQTVPGVGRLRYVVSPDHRHWHLLLFDRYELRPAGRRVASVRDRKTGFCLGDRYAVLEHVPPATPPAPVYTSRCGLGQPGLLSVEEGISVGYGDDYAANLEGQFLPLNGLRAGRYVLVHRVNADGRLHELDPGNDAASLLLALRWRQGAPEARVLRTCPGSARCDRPSRTGRATRSIPTIG
jgi:hypothetical protein